LNRIAALIAFITLMVPQALRAEAPPLDLIRGVVTMISSVSVTVRPKHGKPVVVGLSPNWTVSVMKPVGVGAIQPGSFIGATEMPQPNGPGRALEVHVFPPGEKLGEGHYAWDARQGTMMTNGAVGKVTARHHGRELEVSYSTGTRRIVVPPHVPIVLITSGSTALIRPGVSVFIVARPAPNGDLVTSAVATGVGGAAPPL
jgi:hypothetical protein